MVLQGDDLEDREELFSRFHATAANTFVGGDAKIPVSIALGFARFEAGRDLCLKDVVRRADDAMYENKRRGKQE